MIDTQTNAVRRRVIGAESSCVPAVARALDVDEGEAKAILDAYSFDLDEQEFPTSSFLRWYQRRESNDEAAE